LLCNPHQPTINQRDKNKRRSYLVAARVHKLEPTTKTAASTGNRHGSNTENTRVLTSRRTCRPMLQHQQDTNGTTLTVRATSLVAPAVPNRGDILPHRSQPAISNAKFQSSANLLANSLLISSIWEKWSATSDQHTLFGKGAHSK
jgi:hypothetical protein